MSLSALSSANRSAAANKPLADRPRSSNNLQTTPTPVKEKRSLPPPITASTFAVFALLQMCRRYILFKVEWRIGVYMVMVTFFSVITDFYPVPKSLTFSWSGRGSLINVVFVKWSLLWTLSLLALFVYFSSSVLTVGNRRVMKQQFARLIIAFCVWYLGTTVIELVNRATGWCFKATGNSRQSCEEKNGVWKSFDISGHTFLLIYCTLSIAEELKVFRGWGDLKDMLNRPDEDQTGLRLLSPAEVQMAKSLFERYDLPVRIFFVALTVLAVMWDFMLLITQLFYHKFAHKLIGALMGIVCWLVTYRGWYLLPSSPGMPGATKIRYQRH